MNSQLLPNLFSPIDVGPVRLRNRIFSSPHATMFASDGDYLPGEKLAYYCAERAKGGAALVEVSLGVVGDDVTSSNAPSSQVQFSPINMGNPMILNGRWPINAGNERVIEGYSRLAKMVHEYGAKCFIELISIGSNLGQLKGVSAFPWPGNSLPFTPREMTEEEIEHEVEAYGKAAKYVKDSGLDGVDLLASHGELLSEFLSPVLNKRKDKYGGSLDNRMRLVYEVLDRVREYVSDDIAVGMRLAGEEKFDGGNTPADTVEIARRLDGKIDWVSTDLGFSPQDDDWQSVPMYVDSGYNLRYSSLVKPAIHQTKLGVVGRYVDPLFAERLIAEGQADMVAMTRALIADPELPNKAREGRLDEIRPCIGALQDCWGRMIRGLPISCTVNPVVSREKEWGIGTVGKTAIRKSVLIIGAGPAGLEAARVSAERGHKVVIYERKRAAGGQVLLAAKLPGRVDIKSIISWQLNQLRNLGVEIKYGLEVTPEPELLKYLLDEENPDVVVVATGSTPIRTGFQPYTFHEIDGWDQPSVHTDFEALEGSAKLGRSILIADSLGFIEAPGIAELLSREGKDVQVVTPHPYIATELKSMNHWEHLLPRLIELKVKVIPFSWIEKINKQSVVLYNVYKKNETMVVENIDNVVLLTGKMQNDGLFPLLKGKVKEVYLAGDANIGGARIGNAIYDGNRIGRMI